MSKHTSKPTPLPPVHTGSAWLPVPPTAGSGFSAQPVQPSVEPDPTAPLNVTPDMFVDGVTETGPTGTLSGVPTNLCATPAAALQLQNWLQANGVKTTIEYGAPMPEDLQTNEYKYSQDVPFLTDGTARENVGQLLSAMQYWGQISRSVMLSQTVGAFATDDALAKTDPTNDALEGGVPNENDPTPKLAPNPTGRQA